MVSFCHLHPLLWVDDNLVPTFTTAETDLWRVHQTLASLRFWTVGGKPPASLSLFPSYFFHLLSLSFNGLLNATLLYDPLTPLTHIFDPGDIIYYIPYYIFYHIIYRLYSFSCSLIYWAIHPTDDHWSASLGTSPQHSLSNKKTFISSCDILRKLQRSCSFLGPHLHLKCTNIFTLQLSRNNLFASSLKSTFPLIFLAFQFLLHAHQGLTQWLAFTGQATLGKLYNFSLCELGIMIVRL